MSPKLRLKLTRFAVRRLVAAFCVLTAPLAEIPVEPAKNPFAADAWKLPEGQPAFRAGPNADLVTNNCLLCHSADYVATQPPLTRAQWQAGVEKMRGKFGAPIKTNDMPALVDYLTKNYGKENPAK